MKRRPRRPRTGILLGIGPRFLFMRRGRTGSRPCEGNPGRGRARPVRSEAVAREDEIEALLDVDKLYDGDLSGFQLARKRPEEIRRFLRRRPNLAKLNTALLAILAAIRAQKRREAGRD